MRVGILGSGDVGQALGNGFVSRGHIVKLGAREARNEKAAAWAAKHPGKASAGTFKDAATFGETLVVATLWSGTENALSLAGKENFEQVQRWLPGARVVKVFNTVGNAHMVDPKFRGGP